jgi:hypothetical protein
LLHRYPGHEAGDCIGDNTIVRARRVSPDAGFCFCDATDLRRTLEINGKQASAIWAGVRGSRRASRTCAFANALVSMLVPVGPWRLSPSPRSERSGPA